MIEVFMENSQHRPAIVDFLLDRHGVFTEIDSDLPHTFVTTQIIAEGEVLSRPQVVAILALAVKLQATIYYY